MSTYRHTARIDRPRAEVAAWYARPGAVVRLSPSFGAVVLSEPTDGLEPGSACELMVGLPWAEALLPRAVRGRSLPGGLQVHAGVRWTARHTQYAPGESFTDVMERGPLASWTHRHRFADDATGTLVEDDVDYRLPGRLDERPALSARAVESRLERVFAYRTRQTEADLALHARIRALLGEAGAEGRTLTVAVAGASGLVGTQLSALLRGGGHRVLALRRRPLAETGRKSLREGDTITWDPDHGILDPAALVGVDAVVNLSGESIAGPFTAAHRKAVLESRLNCTNTLVAALKAAGESGPRTFVSASATGYYGHDAGEVSEDSAPGSDFLADVCVRWEAAARKAEEAGVRVVLVRTGLVTTAAGGLLGIQLPLYQAGLGGPLGGGRMWQPWIGLDDLVQIYATALADPRLRGPVNAAAPHPVRQKEFARTLGAVLHRPAVVPTPGVATKLLLGRTGGEELALSSARVRPDALEAVGYRFRHEHLEEALRHTLGREK